MQSAIPDFKTWIIWTLRKASYRWPARSAAFREAAATPTDYYKCHKKDPPKRNRNFYWCALCELVFTRKEVSADHIKPVVDPKKGFIDWNTYIPRLFCEKDGFQIICKECHDAKTAREKKVRAKAKRERR